MRRTFGPHPRPLSIPALQQGQQCRRVMKAKMERGARAPEYDAGIGAMDRNLPQALAVSLALACLLAGCGGAVMPSPTTVPGDRSSIRSALPNAEYVMQGIADGKVQLHDGEYEEVLPHLIGIEELRDKPKI